MTTKEVFTCSCHSNEHTFSLIVDQWDDDGLVDVILTPYLHTERNVFQRFAHAFKYIFNEKQKRGAFDEVILTLNDITRFQEGLTKALKEIENSPPSRRP